MCDRCDSQRADSTNTSLITHDFAHCVCELTFVVTPSSHGASGFITSRVGLRVGISTVGDPVGAT